MNISREEALKAVDDIFNYCEEIDNSLPENERSGYKMLPDIHKIRKYIIENTRPHGEWVETYYSIDGVGASRFKCSKCENEIRTYGEPYNFCPNCGASMVSVNSKIEKSNSKICPCIECCKIDNSEPCRKGCSEYQKWKESEME